MEPNGAFQVDPNSFATTIPGLFAAGDAVAYPGTIVEAMAAGRRAAQSIASSLEGTELPEPAEKLLRETIVLDDEEVPSFLARKDRWQMPSVSPKDAVRSFGQREIGYADWQVMEEAKRCLNCRMCGNCVFGRAQICFETSNRLIALK